MGFQVDVNRVPPAARTVYQIPLFCIAHRHHVVNARIRPGLLIDGPHPAVASEFECACAANFLRQDCHVVPQLAGGI